MALCGFLKLDLEGTVPLIVMQKFKSWVITVLIYLQIDGTNSYGLQQGN